MVLRATMMRLRLFILDGSNVVERTFSRFPVRIGRHPHNECQVVDTRVSRYHAHLDCEGAALVLRDVGSSHGTFLVEDDSEQVLRSGEARATEGRLAFLIGGVRIQAQLEECDGAELPDAFVAVVRHGAMALLDASAPAATPLPIGGKGQERIGGVIDALFRTLLDIRFALHGDGSESRGYREPAGARSDAANALLKWTQAANVALRLIEHAFDGASRREEALVARSAETIDALLEELSPERLEAATNDVCTDWPATRASAVWTRYRAEHRKLVQRHARPGPRAAKAFADACVSLSRRSDAQTPVSEERRRIHVDARTGTGSGSGELPPPSSR